MRFHALDACRAAAMMLGLFFHGAISFMTVPIGWAVRDRATHEAVDAFVWISHTFRMPVFFLMAGFFARLLWVKRGPAGFVRHRAQRILLPFLVAVVPIMISLGALWRWGAEAGPAESAWTGLEARDLEAWRSRPSPGHLWFLYYLLMILAVLAAFASAVRGGRIARAVDALLRGAVRFHLLPLLMAAPVALALHAMNGPSADTPVDFLPVPRILAYYGIFAGFGWFLHRQPELVERLGRRLWLAAAVAVASMAPMGMAVDRIVRTGDLEGRWTADVLVALFSASLATLFVGLFVRFFSKPRPWVAWLSDSAYWCYIVHLPVVVLLQILLATRAWPGPLKYALIMAGTLAFCLGTYALGVRRTFLGRALNGERKPAAA